MSSLAQGAVADVTRSTVDIPLPQDEGDLLVAQWLGKARADQKHMSMSAGESGANSDAAYTDYVNQPGFFDLLLVNDDLERTYRALKTFVMEHYYADEVDVDEGDDVEPEA